MSELGGFGIRKNGTGGTPITVPVSIANGGTNATSFTAPSGNINPIPYFDGTRFVTDSTPSHLGYDALADTVYTGKINISSSGTSTGLFTNTATQSPTAGAGMEGFSDSGSAMVSGNRLGFYTLGGATNSSHTTNNSIAIEGFATENWSGTSAGARLVFSTTANGGTTRSEGLSIGQDKTVKISNAYTLPTTAPTSGQVLGYSSAGVTTWVTPTSASGIWGISNSSGVYTYYATLTLAVAGATSGQTIELFTDVVESTSTEVTLKDGVDINFNGHSYTLSSSGTASCFLINYIGRNRFYNGRIVRIGGTSSTANSVCILINNATSSFNYLDFFGVEIYSSFGVGISSINGSIPYISGANIRTFNTGAYFITGVYADKCTISTFGGGNAIWAKTITNSYVETSAGGNAILFPYSGRASNCYAYAYGSGSGFGIYCQSGVVLTNCTAISTRNSAIYNFAAQSYNCYAYSTAGAGFECGSNAGGEVYNSSAYSTANSGVLYANTINGCNITSTLSYAVEGINGGVTSNVYNSYLYTTAQASCRSAKDFMNNIITCTWNNASGHGIQCLANNTITNNTIIVTNASANALYSASAISLKYANNCFKGSTTPVNANITQSVTNTQDNQGNILL